MAEYVGWLQLRYAALCQDCEVIFDVRNHTLCPGCAGGQWMPLARWMSEPLRIME